MLQVELAVEGRKTGTQRDLRAVRGKGLVPGNIYGPGLKNASCAVDEKLLRKAMNNDFSTNAIITFKSNETGLNGKKVILKSVSRAPLNWALEHVDFYEIAMNRPLNTTIAIHYTGTPEGVKVEGGILQIVRRAVRIRALPGDIPEFLELDISNLKIGDNFHVSDLKVSDKVKILDSGDFTLVSVAEPEKEEVVVAAAPTAEGAGAAAATGTAAAGATPAAGATAAPAKS